MTSERPTADGPETRGQNEAEKGGTGSDVHFFQQVRAVGGFAYGVIGADIHVFENGTPVYLLFAHHGTVDADPDWMRAQPSRMLDSRAEVVDFTGRDAELRELIAWRKSKPQFSVRLLHGEGGQGKTRLAARLAADSERAGWKVVHAMHGTDAHPPAPGSQDLRLDGTEGALLIVDYADRWPLSDLSWLFSNMLLRQSVPARVLLIGRSASGWRAVRGRLDQFRENIETSDQLLEPLPHEGPDRGRMFAVARDCFARHYPEISEPLLVEPLGPLDHPDYGLTLMVHMAALVAVDAAARRRKPPDDMLGLTAYLLDREHENWKQLFENSASGLDYQTPDTVMARVVFISVLCGPVDRPAATALLGRLMPDANPEIIVADHAVCYPPDETATALVPLLPDRLAEDFLALMIPGHAITGFVPDVWTTAVPEALLTAAETARHSPRAVSFLAAAAGRWPHVGGNVLYPLLRERPGIAVQSGSGGLARVAVIGSDDDQVDPGLLTALEAVEPLLPAQSHVDLDIGILAVAERLTAHRLLATSDPAERAWLHGTLGRRRGNAGEWALSLDADAEAAHLNRQLAGGNPGYRPHLAMSLRNLGNALSRVGRWSESLACGRESVAIYRELAAADPARRSGLAGALNSLGLRLRDLDLDEEALEVAEEAVGLWRELAEDDPTNLPEFIGTLGNFGLELDKAGRLGEAVAAAEEVERLYRQLAGNNPAAHLPHLAMALVNLGLSLQRQDRHTEALAVTQEAVGTFRRLAKAGPAAYTPDLVTALLNLSAMLWSLEHRDESLAPAEEAVALARRLATADPVIHRVALASSLHALSDRLAGLGRQEDALPLLREASDLYAKLADASPSHERTRYLLTHKLADIYRETGDRQNEAEMLLNLTGGDNVATFVETIDVRGVNIDAARRAADLYHEMNDPRYEAAALINLSAALLSARKATDAIEAIEQAVVLYHDMGEFHLEAAAASNLSAVLLGAGQFNKAVMASERACAIYQEMGECQHRGTPHFNLGKALLNVGRIEESITAFQQAAEIYREKDRGPYEESGRPHHEADALSSLSEALTKVRRLPEAAISLERAVALYHLTGRTKKEKEELLALSVILLQAQRFDDAVDACERAVSLCRKSDDIAGEGTALVNLGHALVKAGRAEAALGPCEQAAGIFRELGDAKRQGSALNNLVTALSTLGKAEESLAPSTKAAACLTEAGDHQQAGRILDGLGRTLLDLDRSDEAATAFEGARASYQKAGDRSGECGALRGLAASHLTSGHWSEAAAASRLLIQFSEETDGSLR